MSAMWINYIEFIIIWIDCAKMSAEKYQTNVPLGTAAEFQVPVLVLVLLLVPTLKTPNETCVHHLQNWRKPRDWGFSKFSDNNLGL